MSWAAGDVAPDDETEELLRGVQGALIKKSATRDQRARFLFLLMVRLLGGRTQTERAAVEKERCRVLTAEIAHGAEEAAGARGSGSRAASAAFDVLTRPDCGIDEVCAVRMVHAT